MMRKLSSLVVGIVVVCALGPAITAPATQGQESVTTNLATPPVNLATPIAEVPDEEKRDRLPSEADDVPMYRGNPARTGEMPGPDPEGQIVELWRVETGQDVWSSPAVVDGVVYIGTGGPEDDNGAVLALDAETGEERWRYEAGPFVSPPTVSKGRVYVASVEGSFYALNAEDGETISRFSPSGDEECASLSSPLVTDDAVLASFLCGPDLWDASVQWSEVTGALVAFNAQTGTELWRFTHDGVSFLNAPALSEGIVVVATIDNDDLSAGTVHGIDAATGQEVWRFSARTGFLYTPVIDAGQVLIVGGSGDLYALDLHSGLERWRSRGQANGFLLPAVVDGVVYVGGRDGKFYKLDATTGEEFESSDLGEIPLSAPVLTATSAYTISTVGTLFVVDRVSNSFEILAQLEVDLTGDPDSRPVQLAYLSPAVSGGQIVVVDGAGAISAYGKNTIIAEGVTVEVVEDSIPLRAAPSSAGVSRADVSAGTLLHVLGPAEEREGRRWWPVEAEGVGSGWVPESAIAIADVPTLATIAPEEVSTATGVAPIEEESAQPEPTVGATPESPETSAESDTTPVGGAGDDVVFEAPGQNELKTLASGSWSASADALINPGTGAVAEPWLVVSAVPSTAFVIEAEIRVNRLLDSVCDQSFGLTAGAPDVGQVFGGGVIFPCASDAAQARLTDVSGWEDGYNADPVLAEETFDPGDAWHTYRLELREEELRLLIDGADVVTATLEEPIDPAATKGQAGLWAQGVKLEVRRVTVDEIDDQLNDADIQATRVGVPQEEFQPTHRVGTNRSANFRAGPTISDTITVALPPETPLQFLAEETATTGPTNGDHWMRFRLENGDEGWLREIDVEPFSRTGDDAALPNALATVTPTAEPRSTAAPEPEEETSAQTADATEPPEPDRDISAQTMPLLELLPNQDQVPAGLVLVDEAERSKDEVIAALGGTEEAAQLLDDWGWSGNAFRDFIADDTTDPLGETTFLNVSVHRFADAKSAAEAMIFLSDQVIFVQGLEEVEPPAIGESARLLRGAPDGVPLTVLYAQQGPIMYRVGGSTETPDGDPTADVLTVAGEILPAYDNTASEGSAPAAALDRLVGLMTTPEASPDQQVTPQPTPQSVEREVFLPTHRVISSQSVNLRTGPSWQDSMITPLGPATPLQYLGEDRPTNRSQDGPRWMKFRVEDGREGWLRQIDTESYEASHPLPATPTTSGTPVPTPSAVSGESKLDTAKEECEDPFAGLPEDMRPDDFPFNNC